MSDHFNDDVVVACAELVSRTGATDFEIGYLHEEVPIEDAAWYAHAQYCGARLTVENHRSPTGAALALAERILRGATCKCRQPVTLSDEQPGCRWKLMGRRWEPGCTAPPIRIDGPRGDIGAMRRAMERG